MRVERFVDYGRCGGHALFVVVLMAFAFLVSVAVCAQTINPELRPDLRRALAVQPQIGANKPTARPNGYVPARPDQLAPRPGSLSRARAEGSSSLSISHPSAMLNVAATSSIRPGTPLTQILHASQLSLSSSVGTDEQFVDRNGDLIADERTTFDSAGGSFDLAVGQSGARYEVFSATFNNTLVGVLVVALDTNGDYRLDSSTTFNLRTDFALRSAAAVVTGTSKAGREFVIVCSSGYFNEANPNDPNNEPSRGVVFSHSVGNDTVMLALYDDNGDGRADRDEVCVEGLSIDNNLFLHGLTVDRRGNVYVIEDASGPADGAAGNGGTPRIDGFPD